jgi:sugar phosphate isomerase/epimerase
MKLGIGTYSYMWAIGFDGARPATPMTAMALLEKARRLGVRVVQYGPNLPLDSLSEFELDDLIRRAREWAIEIELGTRAIDSDHIAGQIALARRVGATLLRSVPELADGSIPTIGELERGLRALAPLMASAGVRLALENARIPASELAAVLDRIGSPWVGITLDTVNSLAIPEGTREVARHLARHALCLHVKDFAVLRVWHMMGFNVEGRPAGKGQLDLPWLIETLRAAGRDPNAILELWPPEQSALEETIALEDAWAVESILYLRRLIPN